MNQPYQRVQRDSIWNGAAVGAMLGAGGVGVAHVMTKRALDKSFAGRYEKWAQNAVNYIDVSRQLGSGSALGPAVADSVPKKPFRSNFGFGSGRQRLATYAAGVIGMGLVGAAVDGMNRPG